MDGDWRKRIQIILVIGLVVAGIRVGFILYERKHEPEAAKAQPSSSSSYTVTLDDYVTPSKFFPYDLKSANTDIAGKMVWVRSGNQLAYYPFYVANHAVDSERESGLLPPLKKLQIKEVIAQNIHGQKQVLAIFTPENATAEYGVVVGKADAGSYAFFINDVFFFDDPHQLYNHWPADVWDAIEHHQVKPGMNELQAGLALGTNIRAASGGYGERTIQYIQGEGSTMVTFSNNKAVSVEPGSKP